MVGSQPSLPVLALRVDSSFSAALRPNYALVVEPYGRLLLYIAGFCNLLFFVANPYAAYIYCTDFSFCSGCIARQTAGGGTDVRPTAATVLRRCM